MEIYKSKFLTKIIVAICIFLALVTFAVPTKAYASWGGTLLTPIVDILVAIGDTIMEILHESIQEQDLAIIRVDGSEDWWKAVAAILATILAVVIAVVVIAVVVCATGGVAAGVAALTGGAVKAAFISGAVQYAGIALVAGVGVRNS